MNKFSLFSLFITSLLTLSFMIMSCGEDDSPPEFQVPAETIYSSNLDSIQVDFALLNIRGEQTTSFAYGEDIIFDLKVYNKRDRNFWIPSWKYLLGDNMFRVFTSEGQDLGTSWYYEDIDVLMYRAILAHSEKHWQCPWLSASTKEPTHPFVHKKKNRKLTKGKYYVVAPVHINDDKLITCVIYFNIE